MEFDLTMEQRLLQDMARDFAKREIEPVAAGHDREEKFPRQIFERARELGLVNLTLPEEYGGGGLGAVDVVAVTEQLARACVGITAAISLNGLVAEALVLAGTEEQKRRYLPRIAAGELAGYAVTEPAAGSDVASLQTTARRQGDGYVLNGAKTWISNATEAGLFLVFVKTDPEAGHKGLSAFLVERNAPGLEVGPKLGKMGQKAAPAAEVFLTDVHVPAEAMLGQEGKGFRLAMQVFDRSRPMVAAMAVGLIQRCLDESLAYSQTRPSMGLPIILHQAVGHKIAEMSIRLEAARLLTYQAAWLLDAGKRNTREASAAKAFAADSAMWAATEAVQVFGGMGYSTEYPVEKLLRDAKLLQIYEGTSEIQRSIIVKELVR